MKKKIYLLLVLLTASCNETNLFKKDSGVVYSTSGREIQEIIIDNCEYIGRFDEANRDRDWGTHKGNCSNPIHYKKIVVDTVEYKLIKKG